MLRRPLALLQIALVALPLALTVAGCDVVDYLQENNPLEPKKKPLEGARKPVFSGGVPGIEYNTPPAQPTNSNIPITAVPPPQEQNPPPTEAQAKQPARVARGAQRPVNQADDPWAEARPQPPGDDPWADGRLRR